jgi:hypothetical protein
MPAGWNVRVTTFDSEGKPCFVRNFLAYEADKHRAVELVRKRVPVQEGELAEAIAEVAGNVFAGPGMRPGDVRRLTSNRRGGLNLLPRRRARGRNAQGCFCEGHNSVPPAGSRFKFTVFGGDCASCRERVVTVPLSLKLLVRHVRSASDLHGRRHDCALTFPMPAPGVRQYGSQVTRRPGPGCP